MLRRTKSRATTSKSIDERMTARTWSLRLVLLIIAAALLSPAAYSKGSPDKILIKGEGLTHAIEITDRETLKSFDPWVGQFIDWTRQRLSGPVDKEHTYKAVDLTTGQECSWKIVEPAKQDHCCDVFFYMKWKGRHSTYDRGSLKMIYRVRYCADSEGAPGYVYLPGRDDKWNTVNGGTILRDGHDGRWHYASASWDALMHNALLSVHSG